jgi:hypothetical protein
MSEINLTQVTQQPTADSQPVQQVQTQPPAVTVDINAITAQAEAKATEAAEKKMEAVFKSMLQQQGLDAESISKMTSEWRAKQATPESEIKRLGDELAAERSKIASYEKAAVLRAHGLTDLEDIEVMTIRIDRLVTDDKDFSATAAEYFTANPRPTKLPATIVPGVAGFTPMSASESDILKAEYQKAAKSGNRTELSRLIRIAAEKGVSL